MSKSHEIRIRKDFTLVASWNEEEPFSIQFTIYRHSLHEAGDQVAYFRRDSGAVTTSNLEKAQPFAEIFINAYECAELRPCGEMHFCEGMEGTLRSFVDIWRECYEFAKEKKIVLPSKLDRKKVLMEPSMHY